MENIDIAKVGLKHYAVVFPLFILFWIWQATIRFKYTKKTDAVVHNDRRMICLAWHNRIFFLTPLKRIFRKNVPMTGLVSASRDGAYLTAFFNLCGIGTVRGSYMRRGAGAIRDLVKTLHTSDIAITPDGPRGPVHKSKRGFLAIAKISGVRIVLLRLHPNRCIRIKKAWDNFAIPLPFSSVDFDSVEYENYEALEKAARLEGLSAEEFVDSHLLY